MCIRDRLHAALGRCIREIADTVHFQCAAFDFQQVLLFALFHVKVDAGLAIGDVYNRQIRVCMTSDFFLEEADPWRAEAWDIMRQRSDVVFFLLTKRPQRVRGCLPPDWGSGWDNIFFNVTCENQRRADERIPIPVSYTHLAFYLHAL